MDVSITILSVNQCDGGLPMLKPLEGKTVFSFKSKNMTITQDGWILTRRGHVHDGGVNVDFKVNGKSICNSRAIYGSDGQSMKPEDGKVWETVSQMVECYEPIQVKKGDLVTVDANYDLDTHPA